MAIDQTDRWWKEVGVLAKSGAFDDIPVKMLAIKAANQERSRFLAGKLFSRIVNNYEPFLGAPMALAIEWRERSVEWRIAFTRAAFMPKRLRGLVEAAVSDWNDYRAADVTARRLLASEVADILDTVMVRRENAPSAYAKLEQRRDRWQSDGGSSEGSSLLSSALSVVGNVTSNSQSADADASLQRVSALKQKLRNAVVDASQAH